MSLSIEHTNGRRFRRVGLLVIAAAVVGALLNAKDIERYLKIRNM